MIPIWKYIVIKKYSDSVTRKHFIVYQYENEDNYMVFEKIKKELMKRNMRNVGEFIVLEFLADGVYIFHFYNGILFDRPYDAPIVHFLDYETLLFAVKELKIWKKEEAGSK